MTTWRHADEMHWSNHPDFHPVCMACVREIAKSPCTTPTPDPASPCGVCNQGTVMCFYTNTHTYQPTRCTCGHPIEPTPGGTR